MSNTAGAPEEYIDSSLSDFSKRKRATLELLMNGFPSEGDALRCITAFETYVDAELNQAGFKKFSNQRKEVVAEAQKQVELAKELAKGDLQTEDMLTATFFKAQAYDLLPSLGTNQQGKIVSKLTYGLALFDLYIYIRQKMYVKEQYPDLFSKPQQ